MARDRAKDDRLFNCSQSWEVDYVAGLYANKEKVKQFLTDKCKDNTIYHSTHMQVYILIESRLGYPIPV